MSCVIDDAIESIQMSHSFSTTIRQMDERLLHYHYVAVPADISADYATGGAKRLIVTIGPMAPSHRALMPFGDGSEYIIINGQDMKKAGLGVGSMVEVTLTPDTSEYGMELPVEFEVLLEQDEEGAAIFRSLTPGKQRSLLYMVAKPKGEDTRIKKAVAIFEYLKICQETIDFKALYEHMKGR